LAAEINSQLESGAPSTLGFEPISIPELRDRWLDQHENIRRSSLHTIRRYRSSTQYLIRFIEEERPLKRASDFLPKHAEEFVRYLRTRKVAPNGHKNGRKRHLKDCGVKFILEICATLFNYAQRHRHLSPYAENPITAIEINRIPIEDAKPIIAFDESQEEQFLRASDEWQFPVFLTLLMTGLRPGELTHLLLPEDLDLDAGWLHVRNKPELGWKVKTRNERSIPLTDEHVEILRHQLCDRDSGPVFTQRRCLDGYNKLSVRIDVVNKGVAPFYYDWPGEVIVTDEHGNSVRRMKTSWKLSRLLPAEQSSWRIEIKLPRAIENPKLGILVSNPMPTGKPLRFANETQAASGLLSIN
jgi:integrase